MYLLLCKSVIMAIYPTDIVGYGLARIGNKYYERIKESISLQMQLMKKPYGRRCACLIGVGCFHLARAFPLKMDCTVERDHSIEDLVSFAEARPRKRRNAAISERVRKRVSTTYEIMKHTIE